MLSGKQLALTGELQCFIAVHTVALYRALLPPCKHKFGESKVLRTFKNATHLLELTFKRQLTVLGTFDKTNELLKARVEYQGRELENGASV